MAEFGAVWFSLFSLQEQSEHRSLNYEGQWLRGEMGKSLPTHKSSELGDKALPTSKSFLTDNRVKRRHCSEGRCAG